MRIGILTRDEKSWCSVQLIEVLARHGVPSICFSFQDLTAHVGFGPDVLCKEIGFPKDLKAIIVRPIGRGSLEEIIFRMDLLRKLESLGMYIMNPPIAIERSVDKYYALALLEKAGLPVPRTVVTENTQDALRAFQDLGGDVVLKPIFGSRGIGSTRLSDLDIAERVFRTLAFYRQVLYIQEFVPHQNYDVRVFVLGGHVLACMRRVSQSWKTNVSFGAKPVHYNAPKKIKKLAVKATETIGCDVAGVDVLETDKGPLLIEINSQPGWKGLQTVTPLNIADKIIKHVLEKVKEPKVV